MKKVALFAILLGVFTSLSAQLEYNLEQGIMLDSLPVVKGTLQHYNPDFHKDLFISYTILTPEFKNFRQYTAPIAEDGSFQLSLVHKFPYQKVIFQVGNSYRGCVLAHRDLTLNIDLNEIFKKEDNYASKAVTYSGTDAGLNEFYNNALEYKVEKKEDVRKRKFSTMMNRTSQTEYKIKQIREFYDELAKIDKQFTRKNGKEYAWLLEDERKSEMYGDLAFIFIGRPMQDALWDECLAHNPLIVSELSSRYYGILALKLWSHEEREIRSLARIIYNGESETPEEKKAVERFLAEQDKKKAGLSYDNEVYADGLEKYIMRYSAQVEDAKLALYITKLTKIPSSKIGLVGIKGQPLDKKERELYLEAFVPAVVEEWQQELIQDEYTADEEWIEGISDLMGGATVKGDPSLGRHITHMASGAGAWNSSAADIPSLLRQIRNYYRGKALIVYIWDTECASCKEELTRAGTTYDKIQDEAIEIVTLALNKDETQEKWQQDLLETFAKGEHIFLSKKLSAEIFEYFRLPPVPGYLYFNEKGEFFPNELYSITDLDIDDLLSR